MPQFLFLQVYTSRLETEAPRATACPLYELMAKCCTEEQRTQRWNWLSVLLKILFNSWMKFESACLDVPFNLSCFVTILNTFSVSWITIPERPKRQGFLLWQTEVHNMSKDKIIAIVQTGHYRAMKISLQKFGMHTCRTWHSFCHCRGVGARWFTR